MVTRKLIVGIAALAVAALMAVPAPAAVGGDAITYQGRLLEGGQPVTDPCDFRVSLWDMASGGSQIGLTQEFLGVSLSDGSMTLDLDFGAGAFDGGDRWLEIEVRNPAGVGSYVLLSPRQRIAPAPYALHAASVQQVPNQALSGAYDNALSLTNAANTLAGNGSAVTSLNASSITSGVLGGARLSGTYGQVLTFSNASNQFTGAFSGSFTGSGAGIMSLNATNISSGTLADSRLSSNVALRGAINTFTANNLFNARVGIGTAAPAVPLHVTASSGTAALFAGHSATAGTVNAIIGDSSSTAGRGVLGSATAATGANVGVEGQANGTSGRGVFGRALSPSGITIGVSGETMSPDGRAVQALASASAGTTYGLRSQVNSPTGYAGYFLGGRNYFGGFVGMGTADDPAAPLHVEKSGGTGLFNGSTGILSDVTSEYAIVGITSSPTVGAVLAANLEGTAIEASGDIGIYASGTEAAVVGSSAAGWAGSFEGRVQVTQQLAIGTFSPLSDFHLRNATLNLQASAIENDEVIIEATDAVIGLYSANQGTWASALALKEVTAAGAISDTWGIARTSSAAGSDLHFTFGTSDNYAINPSVMVLESTGNAGMGTDGHSVDARLHVQSDNARVLKVDRYTSDGELIAFARNDGVVGNITVAGGVVSYNAFTGSHYAVMEESAVRGELVSMRGDVKHASADGEAIYHTTRTARANDPACLGAYLAPLESSDDSPHRAHGGQVHQIMSVGNGEMWVIDTGTDIQPGDLLISADVPGCAMLDDPARFAQGHIVARAAERVEWESVKTGADGVRRVRLSVLFDRFTRGSDAVRIAKLQSEHDAKIASLREENADLRARLERLEAMMMLERLTEKEN